MARGRICTGYSKPWVALYDPETDTYSQAMPLGRGVSVELDLEEADSNDFRADNVVAESAKGKFGSGSGTSTIDGLKLEAERLTYGLPAPDQEGWLDFNDDVQIPFVGHAYIKRYQEDGVVSYVPIILRKVKFRLFGDSAATQEEDIDWQTQPLSFDVYRANNAKNSWKWEHGVGYPTEEEAENAMKTKLGVQ